MPRYTLEFHPEAVAETQAALQWYRERSESVAKAFLSEIDHAINQIDEAPERWSKYVHGTHRYFLHRFPFSIVYRLQGTNVQVIAVAHGRRRPGYWKNR
jgi:toxin ParE1/3/4